MAMRLASVPGVWEAMCITFMPKFQNSLGFATFPPSITEHSRGFRPGYPGVSRPRGPCSLSGIQTLWWQVTEIWGSILTAHLWGLINDTGLSLPNQEMPGNNLTNVWGTRSTQTVAFVGKECQDRHQEGEHITLGAHLGPGDNGFLLQQVMREQFQS